MLPGGAGSPGGGQRRGQTCALPAYSKRRALSRYHLCNATSLRRSPTAAHADE